MRELRIGVIGTGLMGCEHIRNVLGLGGARIAAVSDPHETSLVWAQKNLGESACDVGMFGDHRDLLASELKLVCCRALSVLISSAATR